MSNNIESLSDGFSINHEEDISFTIPSINFDGLIEDSLNNAENDLIQNGSNYLDISFIHSEHFEPFDIDMSIILEENNDEDDEENDDEDQPVPDEDDKMGEVITLDAFRKK